MKYRVATILLLFISLLSFSQQQNFTLSGKIKGLGNDSVYITLNSTDKNGNRLKPEIMVVKAKDDHFILKGKTVSTKTENTSQVDISHLTNGVYIFKIFSGEQVFQNKIIKQ